MLTYLELEDLKDKPKAVLNLPAPLRLGDRLDLDFKIQRLNGGRSEILRVNGTFKVTDVSFDAERQHLTVSSLGLAPSWQAVRKEKPFQRKVGPAKFPKTVIS